MNTFLKKWRKENLNKASIGKYFLYAIGEILLITIGVLIAVNINEWQTNKKNTILRCQYLEELNYVFEYDIKDVKENILGFDRWMPEMREVVIATRNNRLNQLDSLNEKLAIIGNFIFFGQRTRTKMDELKYSEIDLIGNRDLKNKILLYQDEQIMFLREIERRYNLVDEDLRQYYSKNIFGYQAVSEAIPYDLIKLENDNHFLSLVYQKYVLTGFLRSRYQLILNEQQEIQILIEKEIAKNCKVENQEN